MHLNATFDFLLSLQMSDESIAKLSARAYINRISFILLSPRFDATMLIIVERCGQTPKLGCICIYTLATPHIYAMEIVRLALIIK